MNGIGILENDFLSIKTSENLYTESIMRILMTSPGERVGQPFFGVGLKRQLFDLVDDITLQNLEEIIREQVEIYEPRVTLNQVNISTNQEENRVNIQLSYKIIDEPELDERFVNQSIELEG